MLCINSLFNVVSLVKKNKKIFLKNGYLFIICPAKEFKYQEQFAFLIQLIYLQSNCQTVIDFLTNVFFKFNY